MNFKALKAIELSAQYNYESQGKTEATDIYQTAASEKPIYAVAGMKT